MHMHVNINIHMYICIYMLINIKTKQGSNMLIFTVISGKAYVFNTTEYKWRKMRNITSSLGESEHVTLHLT